MDTRRKFLAAGGALAALAAAPEASAEQQHVLVLYLQGMVWNKQLAAPMNNWRIRLDANAQVPIGNNPPPPDVGVGTLGDDVHDNINSHVQFQTATLKGDQLTITGTITESKTAGMAGESVRIEGKVVGNVVQNLTVTLGNSTFTGSGFLGALIAIIAILIG